jgi:hypothetical protein
VIKPDMQQRFQMEKKNLFPHTATPEHAAYDKSTPGLFKTEFTGYGMIALCSKTYFCFDGMIALCSKTYFCFDGMIALCSKTYFCFDGMIALCSKTYFCFGAEDKFSCKGVNRKTNDINKGTYMDVLLTKQSGFGTNRGFRSIDNQVYTYLQERAGFHIFTPSEKYWQMECLQPR